MARSLHGIAAPNRPFIPVFALDLHQQWVVLDNSFEAGLIFIEPPRSLVVALRGFS